jgi:D-3-phosphoglycerate dehydrogenase
MAKKVLVATEKPFAKAAVNGIKDIFQRAGYPVVFLENFKEKADLLKAVADCDAVIIRSDIVDAEVLAVAKSMKIVVRAGAGYDNVDLKAASGKGVVVMNTPGQNANAVAELAFGLMLQLARKGYTGKSGSELRGKKIGIHAYGNVGRYVALIAKGFGMDIYAFDPFVPAERMQADGVKPVKSIEELYSSCDYVSLHLPKTKETIKSINYALLSKMKKGAVLINTARAEVIDEAALLKMFGERADFAYASDIAPECQAELTQKYAGRFFFTAKKMGAQTEEANTNAGLAAARQIVNFFEKGDKTFQVN